MLNFEECWFLDVSERLVSNICGPWTCTISQSKSLVPNERSLRLVGNDSHLVLNHSGKLRQLASLIAGVCIPWLVVIY